MRVVVVGGGIGGLACAQGLARHGFDVQVVERDNDLAKTGGYRLHLGVAAVSALRDLLSATSFETLLGLSVPARGFTLAVRDHRGRRLLGARDPSVGLSLDVDRITLRRVLALGLEDRMVLGRSCHGWRLESDTVVTELDVGEIQSAVMVIADGAGSGLAERLARGATSTPCGLTGVAGRSPWEGLPSATTALLAEEPMLAIGPSGTGMFASAHDPAGRSAIYPSPAATGAVAATAIWGLIAVDQALPDRADQLDQATLIDISTRLLRHRRWADHVVELVTQSQPDSVAAFRFYASDPNRLAPWRSSRVTALGDAVHAMPPTGGQGAATAIMDAHALAKQLYAAASGEVTTVVAIHDYETDLRTRTAAAVRESLQPVRWIRASANPAGALLLRAMTPVIATGSTAAHTITGRRHR